MKPLKLILSSSIALSIVLASTAIAPLAALANSVPQVSVAAIPAVTLGGTVTISGTSLNGEIILKVIGPTGSVFFFDVVKATNGAFSDTFIVGTSELTGTYKVVAGYGDTVDTEDFIVKAPPVVVGGGGGGGAGGGGGGGDGGGSGASNTVTPNNVEIHPDAVKSNKVTGPDGKSTTTVTIDNKFLGDAFIQLKNQSETEEKQIIAIKIGAVEANGKTTIDIPASVLVEGMKSAPDALIRIYSGKESYLLPLSVLDLANLAKSLGTDSSSVILHLNISVMGTDIEKKIQESAAEEGATSLGHSVDFSITAESNNKKVDVNNFGSVYVERQIVYSGTIKPENATGVLYDPITGDISFVPTVFTVNSDGTTNANIKRNGNSIYSVITTFKSFDDIKGHWAKSDIELLASKLVVSGATDTGFAPEANITRAEFAMLLVRALALTSNAGAASFNDVDATDWFAGAVGAAVKANLVSGFEDGSFQPNAPITREQMAVMVAKALSAAGKTVEGQAELLNKFNDNAAISSWAKTSVSQSVKAGIISGMTDSTFVPTANASRAQAVVMLKRLLQYAQFIN
ncbi:S-layer homology domain-containing protein [Paenibacillus oryzisoli]|uniref:S-layer homology domain-containing protein n=1 Tax=Paenibacillus oryzisoli TaxID=1850517 RepID=UPI000A4266B3|nr:S-layer homology domain-containing protein [Paenibacillus oryzisoli]